MTLVDGYYGTTGDTFEFISRATAFRRGTGLPGMAWDAQKPVFLPDLGKGSGFLRADGAVKVGINRGFAIPCSTLDGISFVMAFLSALRDADRAPRRDLGARRQRHAPAPHARLFGSRSRTTIRAIAMATAMRRRDDGAIARAFASGVPAAAEPMIAIPVAPQGRITAVMALHF